MLRRNQYNLPGKFVLGGALILLLGSHSAQADGLTFDLLANTVQKMISLGLECVAIAIIGFGWKNLGALRIAMAVGVVNVMVAGQMAIYYVSGVMSECSSDAKSNLSLYIRLMTPPILLGILIVGLALLRLSVVQRSLRG